MNFLITGLSEYHKLLSQMGIIQTAIFTHFEKECMQKKQKIGEIRTISHTPIFHSVCGKRYHHVIEHAYVMNQSITTMRMG